MASNPHITVDLLHMDIGRALVRVAEAARELNDTLPLFFQSPELTEAIERVDELLARDGMDDIGTGGAT